MVSLEMKNEIQFTSKKHGYAIKPIREILWVFKKLNYPKDIKVEKNKEYLKDYAKDYCRSLKAELTIYNTRGTVEEKLLFNQEYFYED